MLTCLMLPSTARAADSPAKPPAVSVQDVWARPTPAGAHMGAIYFTMTSPVDDRLTGAAVPHSVAGKTQIHETVMEQDSSGAATGRMSMQEVESVELPAATAVQFKPGGYHVMLIDLKQPLVSGQHVALTLTFAKAGKQKVSATVRDE
jgi:hypothetical protein